MAKFEKVNQHTIKVIVEQAREVDLANLLKGREQLVSERDMLNGRIKNVDEIIAEAKKLGITPKKKDKSGLDNAGGNCQNCNKKKD